MVDMSNFWSRQFVWVMTASRIFFPLFGAQTLFKVLIVAKWYVMGVILVQIEEEEGEVRFEWQRGAPREA